MPTNKTMSEKSVTRTRSSTHAAGIGRSHPDVSEYLTPTLALWVPRRWDTGQYRQRAITSPAPCYGL
ncbi:MAG: hypothetical protein HOH16_02165 [Planctomycetaceae bacterium]|nr:hypothetical protein [Planctomycetaceae bacterium]